MLLADPGDRFRATGIAEHCRTGAGWSGLIQARHRDGRRIELTLRVSASFHLGGDDCYLVSAREQRSQWTMG